MDENGVSDTLFDASEYKNGSFYPMLFGAFLALKLMPEREICDGNSSEIVAISDENKLVQKKLEDAEKQISELKKTRADDGKANEKVVGIFAAREQTWFHHRKILRRRIADLSDKLRETEVTFREKLKAAETLAEEMAEDAKRHRIEIADHKTAFMELEATNQRLTMEVAKMHQDLEHKDQILTAMLTKSKIDTAEKQMLIKELKSSKTKRKQAEAEAARWKAISESNKHDLTGENVKAFVEQLRHKDEKLEAFGYRLMSMEIESNKLQSHIKDLNHETEKLKQDNAKLTKLHLSPPKNNHRQNSPHDNTVNWSKVKIVKTKPRQQEMEAIAEEMDIVSTLESPNEETTKQGQESNSTWKMDIQALGVSYKVKRLKQQLLMLERLTGKKETDENEKNKNGANGLFSLTSLMNRQIERYQSLEGKIDHLCIRMHAKKLDLNANVETKRMENFLEETFEIQRYMVATGQKLIDVQKKIASGFVGPEDIESFDFERFADSLKKLFQEVQRGLEVRISRIIGDLEGTLACDGFHLSRR
ncbi:hypothetical protein ABFS82_06G100400 [Erythranthe guttata]|uniref:plectin-like n=1 Tax=Erythranthe guttata TaxID=4155 RepID=UPI00064DE723|nr:PREDICTED: plectin-like [Erythranthe guttata]|eukprot:XP_012858888.1 PREDICTED: plectin-like [Erythranthe guttata]